MILRGGALTPGGTGARDYVKILTRDKRGKAMEIDEIVNLIINQGLGIACVAYLIYFQNTTMREMLKTLTTISERLAIIEERVNTVTE